MDCSGSSDAKPQGELVQEPSLDDLFGELALEEKDRLCGLVNGTCPNSHRPQSGANSSWIRSDKLIPNVTQECPHTLGGVVDQQWDPMVPQEPRYCLPTNTSKSAVSISPRI